MKTFFSLIFIPLYLFALASQNIFEDREDYPLSRWGMYKYLKEEGPYDRLRILLISNKQKIDVFKKLGGLSFYLNDIIRLKVLGQISRKLLVNKHQRFQEKSKEENMREILRRHIYPELKRRRSLNEGDQIRIYLDKWERLDRSNLFKPNHSDLLYQEVYGE